MAERVIRLTDKEIQWLEAIVMDDDAKDALQFVKEVINQRVRSLDPHHCGTNTVEGQSA